MDDYIETLRKEIIHLPHNSATPLMGLDLKERKSAYELLALLYLEQQNLQQRMYRINLEVHQLMTG